MNEQVVLITQAKASEACKKKKKEKKREEN